MLLCRNQLVFTAFSHTFAKVPGVADFQLPIIVVSTKVELGEGFMK